MSTNTYAYGLDLVSQSTINSQTSTRFYGYDGNGNTRFLTGTNAAVTDTYAYDAFGVLLTSTGSTVNHYRYSGEQFDPNLSFIYLRARYLNPNSGRFWTRDSFAGNVFDPPTLHRYTYVSQNPVNKVDPSGLYEGIGGTLGALGGYKILAGISLATISIAYVQTVAKVATISLSRKRDDGGIVLYHYSPLPVFLGAIIWEGTYLTDNPGLTANQAKLGLGITGPLPTTLYAIRVNIYEIKGGNAIQASGNVADAREWITIVPLPTSRIVSASPILK